MNAGAYGEWPGRCYKDKALVWILGGDCGGDGDEQREVIRAMARGLRKGDGGTHLVTFHPPGGAGSARWFRDEDWLDFNMRQNGHAAEFTGRYDATSADYGRTPPKPVLDGEPIYEDHPVSFNAEQFGHSIASDVRRPLYWDLFSGACGRTYGHHSVWPMWRPGRDPINDPLMPWHEALDRPGAGQMQHARRLLESRAILARVPDDSILVADRVATSVPGAGRYRFVAARDAEGNLRDDLCPDRATVLRPHGRHQGSPGEGLVVRPARRPIHAIGRVPRHRGEAVRASLGRRGDGLGAVLNDSRGYPLPGQSPRP